MGNISIYLLSFNCARTLVQPDKFAEHFFDPLPSNVPLPEILVLSLQEIAPIAHSFLGGSFLTAYFDALRKAVKLVAGDHVNVISCNLGMTAIMIFARHPTRISSLETAGVGVGVHEMGNKGAVGVRLVYAETQLTFVGAHLAPMEDAVLRRNEDWKNIVKGMVFMGNVEARKDEQNEDVPLLQGFPTGDDSGQGMYKAWSYLFVAGDLNYRVSNSKPGVADFKTFPQPTDDVGSENHFLTLMKSDQLLQQLRSGKTLHGLTEAAIAFPPTYKLLPSENCSHWNWAKNRWPSWCDRILYLETPVWMQDQITVNSYDALPQLDTSDHRPVVLSLLVPSGPISEPSNNQDDIRLRTPFDIERDWKSRRGIARKKEIAVGIAAYLGLTWEGNGLLLATIVGTVGSWLIISSLLAT